MISITGPLAAKFDPSSKVAKDLTAIAPLLAAKDSSLWGETAQGEAANRLNWIDLPVSSRELLPQLDSISAWARSNKVTNVILCGMGGSSLAPEVIAKTYQKNLTVLDTTDSEQIAQVLNADLSSSIIVIGSKSGSTIETASQKSLFESSLRAANLEPKDHLIIVTDPNSPLDISARASGYRVVNADPMVGGRFSALSAFGLLPAALLGIDVSVLLDDADRANRTFSQQESAAIKLATILFEQTIQNFALIDSGSNVPGISDWIEQLVAESTGKDAKGRLPIVIEGASAHVPANTPKISFSQDSGDLNVLGTLGEQFILWEWVTAMLCRALEVDPFNQPNVTEAKERTSGLLNLWKISGEPNTIPSFENKNLQVFYTEDLTSLKHALQVFTSHGDSYFAIMAYLNRIADYDISKTRESLAIATNQAVTFGWGPRFLHSTGQFHKGGQPNGAFLQITAAHSHDLEIPGADFTFHTLLMAQALGDGQALASRGLPLMRVHLLNRSAGIAELLEAIGEL